MNKEEERSYLQFIKNLNDTFGISKIDYLVNTKAYEILGMSKDDSFHPKYSQERFDLIKREFATDIKLLNFGKELITKSASILKVPTLRAAYDDKVLLYKETNLWDGIKIMAVDGSLKKSEFKKALKIALENGLSESELLNLLKKNSVSVQVNDEEVTEGKIEGRPKIRIEGSPTFHPSIGLELADVPIDEPVAEVLKVYNEGGGVFKADISTPFSWLSFNQSVIRHKDLPFNLEVRINLKKDKSATLGKKFEGYFEIKTSNEKKRVPVRVVAEGKEFLSHLNTKKSTVFSTRLTIFLLFVSTLVSFYNQYRLYNEVNGANYGLLLLALALLIFQSNLYNKKEYYNEKVAYLGAFMFVSMHIWNIFYLILPPSVYFVSNLYFQRFAEQKKAVRIIPIILTTFIILIFVSNSLYTSFPVYEKLFSKSKTQKFAYTFEGNVKTKGLNLRQEPTKNSTSLQVFKKGQLVTIYSNDTLMNSEWIFVSTEINSVQYNGYVLSKYIDLNK